MSSSFLSEPSPASNNLDDAVAPSTRAEAEAALEANSTVQTDAAGPGPAVPSSRPGLPGRTSSGNNYIDPARASGPVAAPFSLKSTQGGAATDSAAVSAQPPLVGSNKETWRPRFDRQQSLKKEDLERLIKTGAMASPEYVQSSTMGEAQAADAPATAV